MAALAKNKLAQAVLGRAPSAPSAPPVRNMQGSMAQAANKPLAQKSFGYVPKDIIGKSFGHVQKGLGTDKPKQPGAPAAPPTSSGMITDPQYWNNIAALTADYGQQTAGLLADQVLADNAYETEASRMSTDRGRARRNLAESLLGRGNVYGGGHRREQTEADQDYILNRGRLDNDYTTANEGRLAERNYVAQTLGPGTGTAWMDEGLALTERLAAGEAERAATGEGDYSLTLGEQIRAKNAQIKKMRAKAGDMEGKQLQNYRKRIQKVRKKRDALVGKKA